MPKRKKTDLEKAAFKYAERMFEQKYDTITRNEVRAEFQHCVKDFVAGYNYSQRNFFCNCRHEHPLYQIPVCNNCHKILKNE